MKSKFGGALVSLTISETQHNVSVYIKTWHHDHVAVGGRPIYLAIIRSLSDPMNNK